MKKEKLVFLVVITMCNVCVHSMFVPTVTKSSFVFKNRSIFANAHLTGVEKSNKSNIELYAIKKNIIHTESE